MENDYYIYFHINLVSNEVFYVGKGKGKRAWSNARRSKYWDNVVNKYGYRVDIIHENLSEKRAFDWEKLYISMFGRKDLGKGNLVNHTDGGEGGSGLICSDETRKKLSESGKNRIITEETRKKLSELQKGKTQSDEARRKNSEWHKGKISPNKGKKMTDEQKQKLSEVAKGKKRKPFSEETIQKMRDAAKLIWETRKQLITE